METVINIRNNHMKNRCYAIATMCGISLYTWFNYSLFDPIVNDVYTPYTFNCLFMLGYLCWDTYKMTLSRDKNILYRKDLLLHHTVTIIVYSSYINVVSLQMSNVLLFECISLMNYVWKDNQKILNMYRVLCICLVRMPLCCWFLLYYNPTVSFPHIKQTYQNYYYINYLIYLGNTYLFFILYDVYILKQIYKITVKHT